MLGAKKKRRRRVDTMPAKDLHGDRRNSSPLSFVRRGVLAGCTLEEMKRRSERFFGK